MTKRDLVAKDGRAIGYIIGSAVINKEFGDFSCSYSTFGFSKNIDSSAVGVDALQAIFLAAMQVSVFIKGSNECNDLSLHWNGANRECDLGLEVPQLELR
jgi:hypothetical protein